MPRTEVVLYQEGDGSLPPLVEFLDGLQQVARERCLARIELLETHGHELQRPHSAPLADGIYELRIKFFRVNYRLLYFFHGRTAAVISHGIAKEKEVPKKEIKAAADRMEKFKADPDRHTFKYAPERRDEDKT
jgi:phage-related protein